MRDAASDSSQDLRAPLIDRRGKPIRLIETLRYERGFLRLESHLGRMQFSAKAFGLRFNPQSAQQALEDATAQARTPLRVRLTLDESGHYEVTTDALPPNPAYWTYAISVAVMQSTNPLLQHKTSWRTLYDEESKRYGTDEVIFRNEHGHLTEGARSNIFVKRHNVFLTPPLAAGVLNGRLRTELLEKNMARETNLLPHDLEGDIYFGNSLRGLIRAVRAPTVCP